MHQSDHDIRNRLLTARLPAMPQILLRLIEHLQADDAGMAELAALIAKDAGMASKILSVANSSACRRSGRGIGLEQSLVALGTDMIKTLVISESVFQTFNNFPHSGGTDLRAFWKSSLTAAVIARDIAREMQYPHSEEAYLAGLLHNVGRLALLATAPKEYAVNFSARDDDALCAVEQRTLQITHAEAGAWLVERWQLDSFLADSVLYHHEPPARLEASHPLIRIVRLAHLLCCHDGEEAAIDAAMRLCGLSRASLEAAVGAAARQVEQAAANLGIDLSGAAVAQTDVAPAPADPVRQRLSEEVRNMVLVSEIGRTFARQQGETGWLESVTRSARLLFDFGTTVVLLENATGQALVGAAGGGQQRLAEFSIPLARGGPLAASALERRLVCVSRDAPELGIAEEQLFRILGSDSLVCLPLLAGQRCLGVLIGGVAAWQVAGYRKRERFLESFGKQAAAALDSAAGERGQAQRQLEHVTEEYRLASRRVVHEVNNPLAIIKNYLSVLDNKLARREPVAGEIAILNEEIDRVGQLINGLADLQPAAALDKTTGLSDAGRVVDEVLALFRATEFVPASVRIEADMEREPAEVEADAGILKQILVNLVKNAVEALPQGGAIHIVNRGQVNRERRWYLELCISDNGPGLSAEVLEQLFAPVRSNKDGAHHGLGLSIVHGLVQQLQGVISCRSGKNGTSFELLLPLRGVARQAGGRSVPLLDSM
ncbi:HDOD domain-containing protein [Janthinobacterium agaricidamnosum]|uniref:histidine kinase n=1 Tax=Janthinobacterium agaricidamnosum NBRC 102515 = DSM 9628 TaxID=1349767 RepID=W0UX38_9BURK|nr:HDOD domain-containing protein [Janthinobacterium agaricidamnosum]CDG81074.1 his Kinase A domain protein [Janthinobacterium agaricidamnosum NBRC 102515 = DSM 9628]